jgi:hypothetical protein
MSANEQQAHTSLFMRVNEELLTCLGLGAIFKSRPYRDTLEACCER